MYQEPQHQNWMWKVYEKSSKKDAKDNCHKCPAGQFSNADQCIACIPGQYSWERSGACKLCEPGRYQPKPYSDTCIACPSGTVSGGGRANCSKACSFGQGRRSSSECIACQAGRYANTSTSWDPSCDICPSAQAAHGMPVPCQANVLRLKFLKRWKLLQPAENRRRRQHGSP